MSNSTDEPSDVSAGDCQNADAILPAVYDELRRIASTLMRDERDGHTLQTTALINEAYVSLMKGAGAELNFSSPNHFLAVAAKVMRRILINHAIAKKTKKRTAPDESLRCDAVSDCFEERCVDLIMLDQALDELKELDENQAKIVELRFFAGMTVPGCSEVLGVSERTIHYEWTHARAWLRQRLEVEP